MRLIDADALKAKWYEINDIDENDRGARFVGYTEIARLIDEAPTIEPSEQYRKGFEDAKRAFELEYAKESENMRKRNAELEVLLNAQKAISAEPCKSAEQNVADVPSGDLINREDAIEVGNKIVEELALSSVDWDALKYWAKELFDALPSADRPSADVVHKPDYSYEADMVKRLKEATSADKPNYNLETIADIVKQLGHLDGCIADILDRPQVNSAEWVAQKEREFEELNRPKGEWIDREDSTDMFFLYKYECSVCGGKNVFNSSYCPNCGAHMR